MKYCAFLQVRYFEENGDHRRSEELMASGRDVVSSAAGILKVIAGENEKQYDHVIRGEDYTAGSQVSFTYL